MKLFSILLYQPPQTNFLFLFLILYIILNTTIIYIYIYHSFILQYLFNIFYNCLDHHDYGIIILIIKILDIILINNKNISLYKFYTIIKTRRLNYLNCRKIYTNLVSFHSKKEIQSNLYPDI